MANPSIDYKKYVEQFGKVDTDQKSVIKKYLDELAEKDEALKSVYDPAKINDCYDFIKECARTAGGSSACISDEIVYKMARDYFIEVLPNAAQQKEEVPSEQTDEDEAETEQPDKAETADKGTSGTPCEEVALSDQADEEGGESVSEEQQDDVVRDEYGFEVYGETPETVTETATETTESVVESENENTVEEEKPVKYDADGCGLLFDFD